MVLVPTAAETAAAEQQRNARRDADLAAIDGLGADVSDEVLAEAADAVQTSVIAENERRTSVEARLTTVLGMVSVAAAVVFGALTSVSSRGFEGVSTPVAVVGAGLMIYAVLQLVNALRAALRGLRRTEYLTISPADVLRRPGESSTDCGKRGMRVAVETRMQHADVNSRKVEAMAVAHTALHNFVMAVLVLGVVVAGAMVWPSGSDRALEGRIVTKLRSDPALLDLLRGPRGVPGPPGQRGEPGPQGPAGPMRPPRP
jgi:hypothetical protein